MRHGVAWLHGELPELVERGVLSPEVAEALRRYYGPPAAEPPARWGQVLLASVGALLVGGGVILILAHNWEGLARPARAAVALGTLGFAQALTLYAVLRRASSRAWIEATAGFLVLAVGAAMALVGQTYHAGGSFEGLMQAWLWLVVLVPYLTGSTLASVTFWGLLVVRVTSSGWRDAPPDLWPLALAALPFLLLRVRREPGSWSTTPVVLMGAVAIFVLGSVVSVGSDWHGLWAVFQVSYLSALVAAASWPTRTRRADVLQRRVFGAAWPALIVVGAVLTFDDTWRRAGLSGENLPDAGAVVTWLVALACAAFATAGTVRLARAQRLLAAASASAALVVIVSHAAALAGAEGIGWVAFNLWLLGLASLGLFEGIQRLRLATANLGLLALAVLAVARFFDTEISFMARGLAFVVLGGACFALNRWLSARIRQGAP